MKRFTVLMACTFAVYLLERVRQETLIQRNVTARSENNDRGYSTESFDIRVSQLPTQYMDPQNLIW